MRLNPYLVFNGQCEAAFKFYAQCLGGKIEAMFTHGETPAAQHVPPEWQSKIMHAHLVIGDHALMAPVIRSAISGGRVMIEGGTESKTLLIDRAPWLLEKVEHAQTQAENTETRNLKLYAIITAALVASTLAFAFWRSGSDQSAKS